MRKISSIVTAVAVIVACSSIALATNNPPAEKPPKAMSATYPITALGGSGQQGTVTLKQVGANQTLVTIALSGEPSGAIEPSHIHTGSCPTPGAVKWSLSNVVHGSSVTTVNAPLSLINQAGFAVNIHQSQKDIATYKACGNITGS